MQLFCLDRDLLEAKRVFRASQAMDVDELGIKAVGGRAARLHDVLAAIKSGFHDPEFSSQSVAQRLGLSRRYVNDLLAESGSGFAERVLEMRLHEARVMLMDAAHDILKVSEIAWTCGFNEVPYFNRRFRRRFGTTPTELREASRRTK
ncbi:helix-turn-helix domain-containing protein [Bradyrhizobium sp. AUGA SZCCT0160]|uniref:helix-turn-helix domain-containing protein n=1 Tax=Bradyrhizobium sp. AUGA SZCCT0160 TaxID=2807662 RepID=UPI001BAA3C01|nr:AraC family transcriptional regulator [Bradyrhizobium sp. AUGA SZCCT0160]MBR1191712.1 helix-turn-helix transcriptional regulator [Bradyrhizobium sp. AUGA SZCCT0160]